VDILLLSFFDFMVVFGARDFVIYFARPAQPLTTRGWFSDFMALPSTFASLFPHLSKIRFSKMSFSIFSRIRCSVFKRLFEEVRVLLDQKFELNLETNDIGSDLPVR
jgi:hypothetical protein